MEDRIEEIRRLQCSINDLVGLLALPAMWNGHESSQRITTLLDGLVRMLRLDFAYARLSDAIDGSPIEMLGLARRRNLGAQPQEVGRALNRWLTGDPLASPLIVPNPVGEGEAAIMSFRLGLHDQIGVLVAGSQRTDFPTKIEMLLLRVAATQTVVWLHEARRLSEQRRVAHELNQQFAQGTRELVAVNEELKKEITGRKWAEALLAGEKRLLEMVAKGDPLGSVLKALCRIVEETASGSLCSILLLDSNGGKLRLGAAPGLPFNYIQWIDGRAIALEEVPCASAAFSKAPIIAGDFASDDCWTDEYRALALAHGLRACWSTPILSQAGAVLGTFALYYHEPGSPSSKQQNLIDQFTHLASIAIERKQAEDAVRAGKARFEGILAIAEDAIISVDSNHRIILFNQGAEKVFGYTQAEIIGNPLNLLLPRRFVNVHRRHIQEFAQSAEVARTMGHRREVSGRRKDGNEFPAEASISKLGVGGELVFTVILRDITERKRAEQRLVTQHTVTQVLAEAATLEEATPKILQAVCECLVWDLAELWRIDRAAGVLRCVEVWHKESIEAPQFVATRHDMTFMPGIGLPGRVWSSREPAYIPDVVHDSNFPRAPIAAREGLHAAFAFPILLGSEVVGVMDFFSREIRQPDRDLLNMMATIGSQMGQFIERKRAEEELRRSEAYLAEAQRSSRTGSFGWNVASGELFWSEETYRIVGLDRAIKPTVEHVFQRIHPEDVAFVRQSIERAAHEGTPLDFEHRFVMPEGAIKHVHVVAHPHKNETGSLEYIGAVTEVTAAKIAFQQIQALKDQLQRENLALREEVDAVSMFEEIVGASPALQKVLSRVSKVAPTDSTVLITGETGTGKELVARAIHKRSPRASRAFVSVNCAAIPASLVASELFGHEKGAFTGATQRHLGRFEQAEGGTIFLDEIAELPVETQVALLRVLQEREFERVGGTKSIPTDVRVIAATNRDLQAAIEAGTFRSELFYRLNVFPLELPSLRARKEDISLLAEYFIDRFAREMGRKFRGINKKTLDMLESYTWPGNIRELQNVIERSVIICETENFTVDESWLSEKFDQTQPSNQLTSKMPAGQEKKLIEAALAETRGRVSGPSGAAARLGLPSSTLDSKIKKLKINKHRFKTD